MDFNYAPLWQDLYSVLAYSSLIVCFILFYIFKHFIFRFTLFVLTIGVAIFAGRLSYESCLLIAIFMGLYYTALQGKIKWQQNLSFFAIVLLSVAIAFIKIPGIENWRVISQQSLTPDAISYSMKFTFDKSLIGLFFIWFSAYSLAQSGSWSNTLKVGLVSGVLSVLVLIPLSYILGYVQIDIKFSKLFFIWFLNNLFFVCFAEEALFRGLIQNYLMIKWERFKYGPWLAVACAASLFGLAHFQGGPKYILLATVSGVFYGVAFLKAKKLEASIIAHLMVNTVHFLAFTYPALKTAF